MIIIIIAAIALAVLAGQLIMCFKIKHIIPKIIPAAVISLLGISSIIMFFAVTAGILLAADITAWAIWGIFRGIEAVKKKN